MATIFNLLCPICTEVFHNNDEIHSTSCGHVLHYRCMRDWLDRSASCPKCRSPNPSTHRIFLSFDESAEAAANFNELKVALAESELQVNGLKEDVEVKESKIQSLRNEQVALSSQYDSSLEAERTESENLKENIACLEEKILTQTLEIERLTQDLENLHKLDTAYLTEGRSPNHDTSNPALENEIKKLRNDLENSSALLAEEISKSTSLSVECMNLKAKCNISKKGGSESSEEILFKEKNKVLEQKLKHITEEFAKEINKSTQLEISNMKLQNLVDCMKLNTPLADTAGPNRNQLSKIRNTPFASSTESINSRKGRKSDFFDSSSNSIIIQKYPLNNLQYPLENIIALIANNIGVRFAISDIDKVNIVKNKGKILREIVSLFVRFKSRELKHKFLTNKSRLMVCPLSYLRTVEIKEYIDERVQNLFAYANSKLRGNGFVDIFWTNNQVFAKRTTSDTRAMRILSCEQVDNLLQDKSGMTEEISFDFEHLDDLI